MPGYTVHDPLSELSPLMASTNPDLYLRMFTLSNSTANATEGVSSGCPAGFFGDQKNQVPIRVARFFLVQHTKMYQMVVK
jgi:hypothetical protein